MDDHIHPYLPNLAALMRDFADSGKAALGICLGSQLLAREARRFAAWRPGIMDLWT